MKTFKTFIAEAVDNDARRSFFTQRQQSLYKNAREMGMAEPQAQAISRFGAGLASFESNSGRQIPGGHDPSTTSHNYYGITAEKRPVPKVYAKTNAPGNIAGGREFEKFSSPEEGDRKWINMIRTSKHYSGLADLDDPNKMIDRLSNSPYADGTPGSQNAVSHASGVRSFVNKYGGSSVEPIADVKPQTQSKPQVADKSSFELGTQKREPDSYKEKQQEPEDDDLRKLELPQKNYASDTTGSDPNTGKRLQFLRPQRQR